MAGGMGGVVVSSDVGWAPTESWIKKNYGDQSPNVSKVTTDHETIEITQLPEEKLRLAKEILHERQEANKLLSGYQRACKSPSPGEESKLPKKPGQDQSVFVQLAYQYLPVLTWAKELTARTVRSDIIAGMTVGVMVIPQSMSYASIAGLKYQIGMYSAFVPTIVYACFGMSRQLAVGPVAMVSLLVQAGLEGAVDPADCPGWKEGGDDLQADLCPDAYADLAFLCAAMMGIFQVVGSVLNFGALVNLLGHPVTSGFTSGAAIIIGLSQVKYFLGYDVAKSQYVHQSLAYLIEGLHQTNGMTLFLGLTWFAYLFINKNVTRKYKKISMLGPLGPLISCLAGVLLLWLVPPLRDDFHVKYTGYIPAGLPAFSIQRWNMAHCAKILPTALTATLIGFMESIAIGKNLATKNKYEIEAGQEMFAIGIANVAGAMFSCYPVTGSFSRSAVAQATGATTQLAGAVTSLVMLATLMFLTELFYYLPKYVLAAVVINSIIPLVAVEEAMRLRRVKRRDFMLWVVAFLGTLFLGVLYGIAVAVVLSLVIVIFESVRPQITVLWRIPGSTIYRGMKQDRNGVFIPHVFICRIGSSMYFANASYIKDTLQQFVLDLQEVNPTKYIILEMTPVVSLDSTAIHVIEDIYSGFASQRVQMAFAMVSNRVESTMEKAKFQQRVGKEWFFPNVHEAVQYCLRHQNLTQDMDRRKRSQSEDIQQQNPLAACEGDIDLPLHEVGVSNDCDKDFTVISITLAQDVPMIMSLITALFKSHSITVRKAEIEPLPDGGVKHQYFVRSSKTDQQLVQQQIDRLRNELGELVERHRGKATLVEPHASIGSVPEGGGSMGELERRLLAQDAKLDRINELLSKRTTPACAVPLCAPIGRSS